MLLKHTLKYLGLSVAGKLTVFADEVAAFSGFARRKLRHADKSGTPFEGKYHLDENGWFIADIPKEKYLYVPAQKENEQIFDIRSYGADAKADFKTNRKANEKLHIFLKRYAYEGKENLGGYPESTRVSHLYIRSHEDSAYYDLPVYGLFVRNAQGVSVQNFQIQPRPCNRRPLTNLRESELYNIQNSKWE